MLIKTKFLFHRKISILFNVFNKKKKKKEKNCNEDGTVSDVFGL